MTKHIRPEEMPEYSEPATIISLNFKDASLRDVWEIAKHVQTGELKGGKVSVPVSPEVAKKIAELRGGPVLELDTAFEI